MKAAPRLDSGSALRHKLARLRELLVGSADLTHVSEYFHEELVLDDAFMAAGAVAEEPRVMTVLQALLGKVAPHRSAGPVFLIRLAAERMCHGFLSWGQGFVMFFYLEEADLGFCSYAAYLDDPNVTMTRFSLTRTSIINCRTHGAS